MLLSVVLGDFVRCVGNQTAHTCARSTVVAEAGSVSQVRSGSSQGQAEEMGPLSSGDVHISA